MRRTSSFDVKKRRGLLLALLLLCLMLAACGSETQPMALVTGASGSASCAYGSALAGYLNENTELELKSLPGAGGAAALEDLATGGYDLAIVQADLCYDVLTGSGDYQAQGALKGISLAAALYPEQLQILTLDKSIRSVEDLKGRTVSLGAMGSGSLHTALAVLAACGLSLEDIVPVYQSFEESVESLKEGLIDAAFMVTALPAPAAEELASGEDLYLVALSEDQIKALCAMSPYYSPSAIPAGTYGVDGETATIELPALLLVRDTVADSDLKALLDALFQSSGWHSLADYLDPAYASTISGLSYHPAAQSWYDK